MIYMFLSNNPSSGDTNSSNFSCFILDQGVAVSVITRGTELCPQASNFILCLVLRQPSAGLTIS